MPKSKVTDWDVTAANNTDIGGIGAQGTDKPSNFDNTQREILAQIAKVNAGTDPVADTWTFGDPADLTKRARLDAGNVTAGQTRVITAPNYNLDLAKVPNAAAAQSFSASEKSLILANIGASYFERIKAENFSNVSAAICTDLGSYNIIRVHLFGTAVASGSDIFLRAGSTNGASWLETAGDYYSSAPAFNIGTGYSSTQTASYFPIIRNSASGSQFNAVITLFNFNGNLFGGISGFGGQRTSSGAETTALFSGGINSNSARNAFYIASTGGNISGSVWIEGVKA